MPRKCLSDQSLLFRTDPRELAEAIGLDWWAAKKLYDDHWLSFDPETAPLDTEAEITEFIFLGSLLAAGCDPRMLKRLLKDLEKPYCYKLPEIYYDWTSQSWKDLPGRESPSKEAEKIISMLEEKGDVDTLKQIRESAEAALANLAEDGGDR